MHNGTSNNTGTTRGGRTYQVMHVIYHAPAPTTGTNVSTFQRLHHHHAHVRVSYLVSADCTWARFAEAVTARGRVRRCEFGKVIEEHEIDPAKFATVRKDGRVIE